MKRAILILLILTLFTGCAPIDGHYNKFETTVKDTQNNLLENEGIIEESFYNRGNIRVSQAYDMSDSAYLVMFYNQGDSQLEDKLEEVLKEYKTDAKSMPVYVAQDTEGDIRLEFITRDKNIYTLNDIWYNADDIEQLPYLK